MAVLALGQHSLMANRILAMFAAGLAIGTSIAEETARLTPSSGLNDMVAKRAPLDEGGYQRVAAQHNDDAMQTFVRRLLRTMDRTVEDQNSLNGFVPFYSGTVSVQSFARLKEELQAAAWVLQLRVNGSDAPLSEEGYAALGGHASDEQMATFIRRVLQSMGRNVTDEGGFNGLVPHYSGNVSVQTFEQLRQELATAPWTATTPSSAHPATEAAQEQASPDKQEALHHLTLDDGESLTFEAALALKQRTRSQIGAAALSASRERHGPAWRRLNEEARAEDSTRTTFLERDSDRVRKKVFDQVRAARAKDYWMANKGKIAFKLSQKYSDHEASDELSS